MSVVGIDFGTRNSTISVVSGGKPLTVVNEVSSRQTPSCCGFTMKNRELGDSGLTQFPRNADNTVFGPKMMLGRIMEDKLMQKRLPRMSAGKFVTAKNGDLAFEGRFLGQRMQFTGEQLVAMCLTKLKTITEDWLKAPLLQCVIAVPGYWSHHQRIAMKNAITISGLTCLRIVNDLSALGFKYGFYNPIKEEGSRYMMFMDLGYSGFSCNIMRFQRTECDVRGAAYAPAIGGGEIDEMLAEYFAGRFNEKFGVTLQDNKRAYIKLLQNVETVKKTLNENDQAGISMECIMGDYDLRDQITREEYEQMLIDAKIVPNILNAVDRCIEDSGVKKEELFGVNWVGSGLRVRFIKDAISNHLDMQLGNTNAEEDIAEGCALLCARLSKTSSFRDYHLVESNGEDVEIVWQTIDDPEDTKQHSTILFPKKYRLPSTKQKVSAKARASTFTRVDAKPFELVLEYKDSSVVPEGNQFISKCTIANIPKEIDPVTGKRDANVRVRVRAEPNGTFSFEKAELVEEKEKVFEVPIKEEEKPTEETKEETKEEEGSKEGDKKTKGKKSKKDKKGDKMETEAEKPKTRQETKIVEVATKLTVQITSNDLSSEEVAECQKLEREWRTSDQRVIDAAFAKNDLETLSYAIKNNLENWGSSAERDEISQLDEMTDAITMWLYGEGDDLQKEDYEAKSKELNTIADKIKKRIYEWERVPRALAAFYKTCQHYLDCASDDEYAHIDRDEMDTLVKKVINFKHIIDEKKEAQENLKQSADPVYLSSDIVMRRNNLRTFCDAILSKPKPKAEPEAEAEPEKTETKEAEETTKNDMEVDEGA